MPATLMHFLVVAAGGAIGAAGRHGVNMVALRLMGSGFPYGTLVANVLGSFAMGALIEALALRYSASQEMRLFLATGLLGGFTTFSAFSLDTILMWERGNQVLALTYVGLSVVLSLAALATGLAVVRGALS